jgi:hypothetical protein
MNLKRHWFRYVVALATPQIYMYEVLHTQNGYFYQIFLFICFIFIMVCCYFVYDKE